MNTLRKSYKIVFWGNPFLPRGKNHNGNPADLIEKDFMIFSDEIEAYYFLLECTDPITKVSEIFKFGRVPRNILNKNEEFTENMDSFSEEIQDKQEES